MIVNNNIFAKNDYLRTINFVIVEIRYYKCHVLMVVLLICLTAEVAGAQAVRVGLAWQPNPVANDRVIRSIELAGGKAVLLPQVRAAGLDYDSVWLKSKYLDENGVLLPEWALVVKRNTYCGAGLDTLLRDIDAVVFLGGGDIGSTLFREPQPWGGETCDATRDVSEYLTMAYCLDHDIPVLGLCRGMQMLAVVSGASLIQDLDTYFESCGIGYEHMHRSLRDADGNRHYMPHDVVVTDHESLLYSIALADTIHDVPSWHHQAVGDVAGTPLKVSAVTLTHDVEVIEAVERTDKKFALGVQYHPEEAVRQYIYEVPGANRFMPLCEGVNYFRKLIKIIEQTK